ncbi:cholesteryl ester transfer protein [Callorhinchus milii]|uniref:Cholesteryl ester transfer protein n=1 Tax=Callorhinchus milii TaxID=7868 RepID=A0A4W3IHT2_CALMI|nr:cholesteryl ester transfer protein [Callorhinchus milii]|eukprot:gi/632978200/ref/XP_007905776.1/ PREDICTED: cholesteryl ester transfer protein [Callorhinchus milii]
MVLSWLLIATLPLLLHLLPGGSFSCVPGSGNSSGNHTGLICRLTKAAALVLNQETTGVIQATYRQATFPNVTGESSIPLLGSMKHVFKNLQVNNMSIEKSDVDLGEERGISIDIQNVAVLFKGTIYYSYTSWLLSLHQSVDFEIESQADLYLSVNLACDRGRVAVTISDCFLNFDKLILRLQKDEETSWIQQLFTDFVSFTLRHVIKKQICAEIHQMANLLADFILDQAAAFIQDGNVAISTALISDPVLTDGYIESRHTGDIFYKNLTYFQQSNAIPGEQVEERMFNLWVSEQLINSLFLAAYLEGHLSLSLSDQELLRLLQHEDPVGQPNLLQQIIPDIPAHDLVLHLWPLRAPVILFTPPGTILQSSVAVELRVKRSDKDPYVVLYMEMDVKTTIETSYSDQKVRLRVTDNLWSLKVVKSAVEIALDKNKAQRCLEKFFSGGGLKKIISYVEFYLMDLLNKKGLHHFEILNPLIQTEEGYVIIATDFAFPRHLLETFLRSLPSLVRA